MSVDFSAFADLSGVVSTLIKDLEGKALSQTDLIKYLPKFVGASVVKGLTLEKAEAQILAAIKFLINKYVPEAQREAAIAFVDSEFPMLVKALNGLIDEVKGALQAKATAMLKDATAKIEAVCTTSCLPWITSCLNNIKAVVPAGAAAAAPAAVEAEPPKPASAIEEVAVAAASDVSAALNPVPEEESGSETGSVPETVAPATE